jgi:hypothetical protein
LFALITLIFFCILIYLWFDLLEKKRKNDKMYYLVKWKGWEDSDNIWEKYNNIKSIVAYAIFSKKQKK